MASASPNHLTAEGICQSVSLAKPTVGRLRNYAEKTVWSVCRHLNIYPRDLYNTATSRKLVNPAVNLNCISIKCVLV